MGEPGALGERLETPTSSVLSIALQATPPSYLSQSHGLGGSCSSGMGLNTECPSTFLRRNSRVTHGPVLPLSPLLLVRSRFIRLIPHFFVGR